MFGKKKKKISEEEAFDSLLFPFRLDVSDTTDKTELNFIYNSGSSSMRLIIDTLNDDNNFEPLLDGKIHLFHKFKGLDDAANETTEYALVVKDFLNCATGLNVFLEHDKNRVCYCISAECENYLIYLMYYDSDMYPSVSKYMVSKASNGIYQNAVKGNNK